MKKSAMKRDSSFSFMIDAASPSTITERKKMMPTTDVAIDE